MFEVLSTPLVPLALGALHWVFIILISLTSVFLSLLILVQRGRGGGLTGALGGMGGQSAFGTKAGDVFTKITVGAALVWILLSMGALRLLHVGKFAKGPAGGGTTTNTGAETKEGDTPGTDTKSPTDITPPAGETPENTPAPKSDEPKAEAPKTDEPKAEAPKTDEPKPEPPKAEEPKPEAPKADEPKADEEKK